MSEFIETSSAVSSTYGLVNEDEVSIGVPRVGVGGESKIVIDLERTIFSKKTSEGRATRATIQPNDQGISGRV